VPHIKFTFYLQTDGARRVKWPPKARALPCAKCFSSATNRFASSRYPPSDGVRVCCCFAQSRL